SSAASECGKDFRQLDLRQGGARDLRARLRQRDAAHGYRRILSKRRQRSEGQRQVFRRHRLELDRDRPPRLPGKGLETDEGSEKVSSTEGTSKIWRRKFVSIIAPPATCLSGR